MSQDAGTVEKKRSKHEKNFSMTDLYMDYANEYHEVPTFGQFKIFAKQKNIEIVYKEAKHIFNNRPALSQSLQSKIEEKRKSKPIHKSTDDSITSNEDNVLTSLRQSKKLSSSQSPKNSVNEMNDNDIDDGNEANDDYDTNEMKYDENDDNDQNDEKYDFFVKDSQQSKDKKCKNNESNNNNNSNKNNKDILASFSQEIKEQQKNESANDLNQGLSLFDHNRTLSEVSNISETPSAPTTPHFGLPPSNSIPKGNSILNKFGGQLPPKPQYISNNVLTQSVPESMQTVLCHDDNDDNDENNNKHAYTDSNTVSTWVDDQMD